MFSVRVDSPLGALDLASGPSSQVDSGALHVPARDSLILRNPNQSVHRESGRITGYAAEGIADRYRKDCAVICCARRRYGIGCARCSGNVGAVSLPLICEGRRSGSRYGEGHRLAGGDCHLVGLHGDGSGDGSS
jgi:hypothetical protein